MLPPPENDKIRNLYDGQKYTSVIRTTDEYGFIIDQFKNSSEGYSGSKMHWYLLIDRCEGDIKKLKKAALKEHLLEKGIPLSLKGRIWRDLAYLENNEDYSALTKMECKYEYQIHVDVQRTFRRHFLFFEEYGKGQSELFRVLTALANYDQRVGYCQGMSDICAVLLMYFPEKEAFGMYLSLVKRNSLNTLFDTNLSKLSRIAKLQHLCLSEVISKLYRHLVNEHVDLLIHVVSWYMTFFTRFNIKVVLRIWDFLFFHGFNVLIYFLAAILLYFEDKLLVLKGERLVEFISKLNEKCIDEDILVYIATGLMKDQKYKFIE